MDLRKQQASLSMHLLSSFQHSFLAHGERGIKDRGEEGEMARKLRQVKIVSLSAVVLGFSEWVNGGTGSKIGNLNGWLN